MVPLPQPWEGRAHLEQEEGRGEAAGFPGALSLLRSWRLRPKKAGGAFSWPKGMLQPSLHPPPKKQGPLLEGMRQQGPEHSPGPQTSVTGEEARPGGRKGNPTCLVYPHRNVKPGSHHLLAIKLTTSSGSG